jgi:polar amino acid transport system substrate-binding protein
MLWTDLRRLFLAAIIVAVIVATLGVFAERQSPAAGQTQPSSEKQTPLRWAADAEGGAPYIFKDPDDPNRNVGFEVDLAAALAEELGRKINFVQYHFDELVPGLERGDYDFAMNGLEVTPDRAARVRFSRPYYNYKQQLVVRADDDRFASLDECKAKDAVVGTLGETAAERLLDQLEIEKRIYDGQVEPYLDLELGRIDAVLLDLPIAAYYARPNPKLKYVGEPTAEGYYAIAFRPEDEELARQVDDAIVRLVESGRLKSIYQKWHIWNDDQLRLAGEAIPVDVLGSSGSRWTFWKYFPILAQAAVVTVEISVLSMILAMALALPISVSRLYGPAPLRWLATVYVEFFRGIPVLLLLYFLYYGLPTITLGSTGWSLKLSPMAAAVLGFGLNYAAYEAEIYRAGILAIPSGQWEAAASLGMRPATTFRRIIVPQAVRIVLPPVTNDFVALFKDTSLVSVIAVVELTKQYQMLAKSSLKYLEIGLATAALYLIMSVPLGYLSRYLEKRWGRHV